VFSGTLVPRQGEAKVFCPDWQSQEAYQGLASLAPHQLAWEFLRRNPDYQRDFKKSKKLVASEAEKLARRWRLRIPR
jgi:hypothetical protein